MGPSVTWKVLLVLVSLVALGCGEAEEQAPGNVSLRDFRDRGQAPNRGPAQETSGVTVHSGASGETDPNAGAATGSGSGGGGGGGGSGSDWGDSPRRQHPDLQDMDEREAERLAQDAMAAARGSEVCQRLFEAAKAAATAATVTRPNLDLPNPDRQMFMDGCERLPPALQRCLVPNYRRTHERTCRRTLRNANFDPMGLETHRVDAEQVDREARQRAADEGIALDEDESDPVPTPVGPTLLNPQPGVDGP